MRIIAIMRCRLSMLSHQFNRADEARNIISTRKAIPLTIDGYFDVVFRGDGEADVMSVPVVSHADISLSPPPSFIVSF